MRARWTPLQRTHRQRRAAERDAGLQRIRLSRGLQGVQCRQSGHGKPRARLRRAGVAAVPPVSARTSRLGAMREGDAQGRPGIEPARPWPVRRGKCCALHITGCSAKCRQSPTELAWCRHRSAPCGFAEPPLCLAPLCTGQRRRAAVPLQEPACALALSRQRGREGQNPRAPARPGLSAAPGFSPAGFSPRARSPPPVRPRERGLPEGQRRGRHAVQGENPPCTACPSVEIRAPSRLPCGAARP